MRARTLTGAGSLAHDRPGWGVAPSRANSCQTHARKLVFGASWCHCLPRHMKHTRSQILALREESSGKMEIDRSAVNSAGQVRPPPRAPVSEVIRKHGTKTGQHEGVGRLWAYNADFISYWSITPTKRRFPAASDAKAAQSRHPPGLSPQAPSGARERGSRLRCARRTRGWRGTAEREAARFHERGEVQRSRRAAKSRRKSSRHRLMWRAPGSRLSAAAGSGSSVHQWG